MSLDDITLAVDYFDLKKIAESGQCFRWKELGHGECYRVPWAVWKDMKTLFRHKHATAEELEPYRLSVGRNGVLLLLD